MVDTPSPARFSSSARLRADAEALRALHRPGDPLEAPVSVLAAAGGPSLPELRELGVARVSFGPGPLGVALAALQRAAGAPSRARRSPRTCGSA